MMHAGVLRWLEANSPVEPSLLEGAGLEALVSERIAVFGGSEAAYIAALGRSPDEVDRLMAGIAVPETWFFRYPRSFDVLLELCQRQLARNAPEIRMLSVGCATGQEACCMALTAREAGWPVDKVRILAIDRNQSFLDTASKGEYGPASIRNEIPAWAMSSLHRRGERIQVAQAVTSMIRFARMDVTKPNALQGMGPFDAIFCRNILIYLNGAARAQLFSLLCHELVSGGILFVGHAETGMRGNLPLEPVRQPHTFAMERVEKVRDSVAEARPQRRRSTAATPISVSTHKTAQPLMQPVASPAVEASIEEAIELADAGRMGEAEEVARQIMTRRGPLASALELLGMIRMARNDAQGAKRFFEEAVYLEPERSASLVQLALLSERSGDPARAATFWERAKRAGVAGGPIRGGTVVQRETKQ